jgi:uncharacterized metal-binding protein YceD (DUF177 family)
MIDSPEFSHPVDVLRLPSQGAKYSLKASPAECAALAKRFGLLSLARLSAEVDLSPMPGGFYRVDAELSAELEQACIVTLEPVASRLEETFTLLFGEVGSESELVLDSVEETVEPLGGGIIDIGETVAQQLSLALDPFPRAPGAEIPGGEAVFEDPEPKSPFAALAKLRKSQGD